MIQGQLRSASRLGRDLGAVLLLGGWFLTPQPTIADQVDLLNGDRYFGTVISLNAETLRLQSETLGTISLARTNVAHINLGATPSNRAAVATPVTTNESLRIQVPPLPKLAGGTNSLQQVQEQMLAGATPEARAKFLDLAGGYLSGRISVNDIRAEAKSAVAQIKSLKAELGPEADSSLDAYLGILEGFLNESQPEEPKAPSVRANPKPTSEVKAK